MDRLTRLFTSLVCAFGAALTLACAADTTAPDPQSLSAVSASPANDFTRCEPQPYAKSSERIGPSGGTLRAGRHTLRIPAGALKTSVVITMESPSDTLNYIVFGPEGLAFDPAHLPTLGMSYRNCLRSVREKELLEIVYVDDSLRSVLETTELVAADTLNKTVHARLRHFSAYMLKKSRYALAY